MTSGDSDFSEIHSFSRLVDDDFYSLCNQVRYEQRTLSNQVCNFSCNHAFIWYEIKKCVPVFFHVYFSTSNSVTTYLIISLAVTISDVKISFIYTNNETYGNVLQ